MIKVLFIINSLSVGGAESATIELIKHIDSDSFQIGICCLSSKSGSKVERDIENKNIPVWYLNIPPSKFFLTTIVNITFSISKVFNVLNTFSPDIVEARLPIISHVLVPIVVKNIKGRIYSFSNEIKYEVLGIQRYVFMLAFSRCNFIPVILSDRFSRELKLYFEPICYKVIPYGIDQSGFNNKRSNIVLTRSKLSIIDKKVLICVARLVKQKNHFLLLQAIAEVRKVREDIILLLVGDGELRNEIELLSGKLDLKDFVRFLGTRDDVAELLAASDIFVMASFYEGMPISILEAMASGLPVVASAVGAVPEIVKDGVTGFLFPSGDVSKMVKNVTTLLSNDKLRKDMGENARIESKKYDARIMARNYEDLYGSLIR